jgi:hypothetical protein
MRDILGIAIAIAAFTAADATATPLSKDEYKLGKARVAAEYQADRQKCGAHVGNPAQLCVARARGAQKVGEAELEAAYKPTPANNYAAAIARADATYGIAKEECDNKKRGEERKSCVKDAKAAQDRAKAEAAATRKSQLAAKPG